MIEAVMFAALDGARGAITAAPAVAAAAEAARVPAWALLVAIGVVVVVVGLILVATIQDRFLYFPDPTRTDPATLDLPRAREDTLDTPDGERLIVWRAEPARPDGPVILYLHGNARALARRRRFLRLFLAEGWGLAALSHRGFGGSTGRPSEAANVEDARLLFDRLVADGASPMQIVIYGESLGSGTAVQLAASRSAGGLILHAPYDSLEDVAAWRVPLLFPRLILKDRYRSIDVIGEVACPILWLHGDKDGVIPLRFGRRLYDAATSPRYVGLVKGVGHFGLYTAAVFNAHIRLFVAGIVRANADAAPVPPPLAPPDHEDPAP